MVQRVRRGPLGVVLCLGPYNYPLNATFCLQPGGATLTRAALYQSIVYGCIPVVFRDDAAYLEQLAFPDLVPYREMWVSLDGEALLHADGTLMQADGAPDSR